MVLTIVVALFVIQNVIGPYDALTTETTSVTRGDISNIVTVSGKTEATNMVNLSFPTTGTVQNVYKKEGDAVLVGEILASLTQDSVVGEYNVAIQNLKYLESTKDELIRGREEPERRVSETSVKIAEENVTRTEKEYARIVQNALEAVRSEGLEALPGHDTNNDIPPTITGSYLCDAEGTYTLSVFSSHSPTNHSYTLTGLEEGTFTAFTDVPSPLGSCGLYIQFDTDEQYRNADWTVTIPNTRSASYLSNYNLYTLAQQQEANAVAAAKQELELALRTEQSLNADPSREELNKINANIAEAQALLAVKEARIADFTIRSPFNGVLTENNIKVGETATQNQTMTVLQEGLYDFKARIPEVDITNIHVTSHVEVSFDARPGEKLSGTIEYISPSSSDIDGVAYYEATLVLDSKPEWIRAGFNADVRIIIEQKQDTLRLPERFIITEADKKFVLVKNSIGVVRTPVEVGLVGNAGYVEVLNLKAGTEVALP